MQGLNESLEEERYRLLSELAELRRFYKAVCYHSHNEARYIHFAKAVEREMKRTNLFYGKQSTEQPLAVDLPPAASGTSSVDVAASH